MKILVTGGAGYIGSHTAQELLKAGHEVYVFDNLSTGFEQAIPKGSQFIIGDIRDTEVVEKTLRLHHIDSVIHFAAKLIVPESVTKPYEYYDNNVGGVISMVKACKEQKIKNFVFSSTAAVYGDENADVPVLETAKTKPASPYGASKLMSEQILLDAAKAYNFGVAVLRYFNVAGAALDLSNGQRTKGATHLIKVASEAACGKRPGVHIYGTDYSTPDGTGVRDYIHVVDLAHVHMKALEYLNGGGESEIFNCGYGKGFSVVQVLDKVKKVSEKNFEIINSPRREGDVAQIVANSTKAKTKLKWSPKYDDLEVICRSAYEWEKSFGEGL